MNHRDALELLRAAIPAADGETWADLGAGSGVFTRALAALVGASGRLYAVDSDEGAVRALGEWAAEARGGPAVTVLRADVAGTLPLPVLDGVLLANVLHFVPGAEAVLPRIAARLRPGGRLVLVEYEGRRPGPWVPYPVSAARFRELAPAAGLTKPEVVAARPSAFGGEMYVATALRAGGAAEPGPAGG